MHALLIRYPCMLFDWMLVDDVTLLNMETLTFIDRLVEHSNIFLSNLF
jgi:hypothetical protein